MIIAQVLKHCFWLFTEYWRAFHALFCFSTWKLSWNRESMVTFNRLLLNFIRCLFSEYHFCFYHIDKKNYYYRCIYFGHQLLRNTIIFSLIPFAANRYTAVKRGARYAQVIALSIKKAYGSLQIWCSRTTFVCIALYWTGSAAVAAPTLFQPMANLSY